MHPLLRTWAAPVWLLLVLATVLSWHLGLARDPADAASSTTVGVLTVAFVKVWLVGRDFMELRRAPAFLRILFYGWTVLVYAVLTGIYLVA